MIHISGLGVAGSYLFRRLSQAGFDVEAFDPKRSNYYLPCGYATNEHLLDMFLRRVGLTANEYILSRAKNVIFSGSRFEGVSFDSAGMCTIEKKKLEEDLVKDIEGRVVGNGEKAEIRVDATGISRALLGKHPDDYTMYAREYLTSKSGHDDFYFYYFSKGHGYFWEFPLGNKFHVGAGSDSADMIDESLSKLDKELVTGRKIRLTPLFDSVYRGNIIGVGEAVGTVSPISGEGIIPSLRSAELLFQAMSKYSKVEEAAVRYQEALNRELGYYSILREIVRKVQTGRRLGLGDFKAAKWARRDLRGFGVDFKISRVVSHFL